MGFSLRRHEKPSAATPSIVQKVFVQHHLDQLFRTFLVRRYYVRSNASPLQGKRRGALES